MKDNTHLAITVSLLLLISTSAFSQSNRRPSTRRTTAPKTQSEAEDTDHPSKSGKLVVGGAHTNLHGILSIHVDRSLDGPIVISVVNGGKIIQQDGADAITINLERKIDYPI